MELVSAAAGETTKPSIVQLQREPGYLVDFKRNVNNLLTKTQQLSSADLDVARSNNEFIRQMVLEDADFFLHMAKKLLDETEHVNSWFRGWWCYSRFSLKRKVRKMNAFIQDFLDNMVFDTAFMLKHSQSLPTVLAGDYYQFPSRESTEKEVIKALRDPKVSVVGVFGMAGVGKTMLIRAIAKQAKEEKLFEEVVMVHVSHNHMLERIQRDVAKELDLMLGDEDTSRAARLSKRLNQGKTMIVLDDLYDRLDLHEAGIYLKNGSNNCCKVVFTTREETVCNQMEADESIEVPVLSPGDSWTLFHEKARIPSIPREIVEECKGFPLAIVTLGMALRNIHDDFSWEDTLEQLKKHTSEGMTPLVSSIKLSYEFLRDKTIKSCFLFCCLFPEHHKIDTKLLLWYLIGENLLENVRSVEKARDMLQSIIGQLASSNLLLKDGVGDGFISMHDVVRDVAISIASEEGFVVKAGMRLTQWPILELNNCKRMSVMKNQITRCDTVKTSHLLTLSMRENDDLKEIPDDLFKEMGSLLTLDLSRTGIKSLPSSLSSLSKLRTLLVEYCNLDCISPLEKLEGLQILSFQGSTIENNPEDIKNWKSSLKLLDLSESKWSHRFPTKQIAKVSNLEELYMCTLKDSESLTHIASLKHLKLLELYAEESDIILSKDIPHWGKLKSFKLCFSTEQHPPLPWDSRGDGPENRLFIERFWKSPNNQKVIALTIPAKLGVANWVKVLMAKTEVLYLVNSKGVDNVMELDRMGLNYLKVLHFQGSSTMKSLISTVAGKPPKGVLSSLEELHVSNMASLKSFCEGMLPCGFFCELRILRMYMCNRFTSVIRADLLSRLQKLECLDISKCQRLQKLIQTEDQTSASEISNCPPSPSFPNLTSLTISDCPLLQHVFSLTVAQGLLQLKDLSVSLCPSMEMIFWNDTGAEKDELSLPSLKILSINVLHRMVTLSPLPMVIQCPRLEILRVRKCHNLKRLPFGSKNVPKLQALEADLNWFDKLEPMDQGFKSRLCSL